MIWSLLLAVSIANGMELVYPLPLVSYVIYSCIAFAIVLLGGLMSGLTVGLLSIDDLDMEIKLAIGSPEERKQARRVLLTTENHHLLLVSLLITNAACMESLPIILDKMVSELIAVIISITFVLTFGEILPQAFCTGPNQLKIASNLCPLVRCIIFILFPISYPIAKLLDCIFGHRTKDKKLKSEALKTLITLHHSYPSKMEETSFDGLDSGQIHIIHGTIDLKKKTVADCMIPLKRVFTLSNDTILDKRTLKIAAKQGFSRLPIYEGIDQNNIVGILLMKKLILFNKGKKLRESGIRLKEPVYVSPSTPLLDLLQKLKGGKSHIAIVKDGKEIKGIITLENLLEQIINSEIFDEDDYDKNRERSLALKNKIKTSKRQLGSKIQYSAMHPLLDFDEAI